MHTRGAACGLASRAAARRVCGGLHRGLVLPLHRGLSRSQATTCAALCARPGSLVCAASHAATPLVAILARGFPDSSAHSRLPAFAIVVEPGGIHPRCGRARPRRAAIAQVSYTATAFCKSAGDEHLYRLYDRRGSGRRYGWLRGERNRWRGVLERLAHLVSRRYPVRFDTRANDPAVGGRRCPRTARRFALAIRRGGPALWRLADAGRGDL